MTELLTAAQMLAIEKAAIDSGEVTGLELMERAGQGVVDAIFEEWPELKATSHRAVVLCGPGNNGGDGFVVARLLKEWGWEVEVFLYGTPEKMPPDAQVNYERWVGMGEVVALNLPLPTEDEVEALNDRTCVRMFEPGPAIIVDALFGTGLTRPLESLSHLLEETGLGYPMSDLRPPYVVALDIPSGICADSGRILGECDPGAIGAHLTLAFHSLKFGHVLEAGAINCGKARVVPIGLETGSGKSRDALALLHEWKRPVPYRAFPLGRYLVRSIDREWLWPGWNKTEGNKYSHGHALIVSGDHSRAGAARLAARGALRIGAGVVTLASPPAAMAENAARLDAIMLREVAGGEALAGILADTRINALCLGPGMGTGAREAGVLAEALAGRGEPRPTVLDADALTLLSQHPDLFATLHRDCILTPHAGEFARLFPDIAAKLAAPATKGPAYSKVDATREAAALAGCVVLYKGPDTIIADPSGRCAINAAVYERAAPWLATAGSGDVLAGFIAGLLARGFAPFDAACTGAWLHVECARSFGPGLIAEDLPEELPKVFRALGI